MEADAAAPQQGPSDSPAAAEAADGSSMQLEDSGVPESSGMQTDAPSTGPSANAGNPPGSNPFKKRKVALFLAYVGHGYNGMQRNPGVKTIEEDLFRAIHAAGGISDTNADEQGFIKIHWMRAARTDKGVSAVGQVVSLKMVLEPEDMVDRINQHLPPQIRVFGFARVTNGFDARKHCDKRRYEYILPAWAFDPAVCQPRPQQQRAAAATAKQQAQTQQAEGEALRQTEGDAPQHEAGEQQAEGEAPQAQEQQQGGAAEGGEQQQAQQDAAGAGSGPEAAANGGGAPAEAPVAGVLEAAEDESDMAVELGEESEQGDPTLTAEEEREEEEAAAGSTFVFDQACADRLTAILSQYEGTHNFHNFTVRMPASAPQARRYMLSFKCEGTFEINGQPWVKMVVVGQSFMLHQIRKMVGLAVAEMRGTAPPGSIKLALRTQKDLNAPMAPELGLFLDECYYESYSKQWGHQHGGDLALAPFAQDVEAFKAQWLYPHIARRDGEEHVNRAWLRTLNEANYEFSLWADAVAGRLPPGVGGGLRAMGRPPLRDAGTAAFIGGLERYGHKRRRPGDGGGRGGGRGGGGRGGGRGAKRGRGEGGGAGGHVHALAAADYSD